MNKAILSISWIVENKNWGQDEYLLFTFRAALTITSSILNNIA